VRQEGFTMRITKVLSVVLVGWLLSVQSVLADEYAYGEEYHGFWYGGHLFVTYPDVRPFKGSVTLLMSLTDPNIFSGELVELYYEADEVCIVDVDGAEYLVLPSAEVTALRMLDDVTLEIVGTDVRLSERPFVIFVSSDRPYYNRDIDLSSCALLR
jgi:hypothetical protein